MTADLTKLGFHSQHPIDKIVQEGEITIVNDGDTGTDYYWANIETDSTPNTYGRAGLIRARWSIDGGSNWQSLDSVIGYTYTVETEAGDPGHPADTTTQGLDSAISIGADDNFIYFRTANGKHGTVTGTSTPSYTPTSRTFIIQWWMYERE